MFLSVLYQSSLGNVYGVEKTAPANSKLSLRDEEHIAVHSVVWLVWLQFGAACVFYVCSAK